MNCRTLFQLVCVAVFMVGCGVSVGKVGDPVDVTIKVSMGGKPVEGLKIFFLPQGDGLGGLHEIKEGKVVTKLHPIAYSFRIDEGTDAKAYAAVPEPYRTGQHGKPFSVLAGKEIEINLE